MITNRIRLLMAMAGLLSLPLHALPLTATLEKDQLTVTVDGKLFTAYKFSSSQKYPYFFPVNGPASGTSVTTETSEPYPHHHSLFFGCDRVNGGNYWQDTNGRGQILSQGPKIAEAQGERIAFTDECLWKQPDQDPIIRDTRRVTITAPGTDLRILDFEITLEPLVDITIEKTNHSLFSARMTPELCVTSGGTLINAEGASAEKGTFGLKSPWCDYSGTRNGVIEGLAIFQNPANRWYPAPWFTRDYGFFSPTPMYWIEGDKLVLPKAEKLTLQYRVIIHTGDAKTAAIASLFQQYASSKTSTGKVENTAATPVPRDKPAWQKRHQAMNDRVKEGHANLLWIGDSIVENWEHLGKSVWAKYYAHRDAVNLGISGDRTEHVLWRLQNGNLDGGTNPKLAIVMIGQNNGPHNTAEEIAEGVTAIINLLRQKLPNTKILLLAIFFRGQYPNDEQLKLAKTNDIIAKLADNQHIFYMDVNKIFLNPDGSIPKELMPDYEHPSTKGFQLWAQTIEPNVAQLLGDTAVKP